MTKLANEVSVGRAKASRWTDGRLCSRPLRVARAPPVINLRGMAWPPRAQVSRPLAAVLRQVLRDAAVQSGAADLLWEALKATITPSVFRWGATGSYDPTRSK